MGMRKKVKINGFDYWYDELTHKLHEIENDPGPGLDMKFLTENERKQVYDYLFYGGRPMLSFY